MREVVLDASVIIKWFRSADETDLDAARAIRTLVATRRLSVIAPPLLAVELIDVAARRWRWARDDLVEFARALGNLGFTICEASLRDVVEWTARGLSAYDATYVALAESAGMELISADRQILTIAPHIAISPAEFARTR